jgi:hypothetical protein
VNVLPKSIMVTGTLQLQKKKKKVQCKAHTSVGEFNGGKGREKI